jgi:cytidylate kinase
MVAVSRVPIDSHRSRSSGSAGGPLVTISASWGTGGSWIAPRVADALGVAFVDRALTRAVTDKIDWPVTDTTPHRRSLGAAIAAALHDLAPGATPGADPETEPQVQIDRALVADLHRSGGVVLGRAGAVVLGTALGALHVRLVGSERGRIDQGMGLERVDEATARWHLASTDSARDAYVRHFHQVDPQDPALYQLTLDSTRLSLAVCVETIVTTTRAMTGPPKHR